MPSSQRQRKQKPTSRPLRLCGETPKQPGGKRLNIFSHLKISGQDYTPYLLVFLVAVGARFFFLIWIDNPILFFKYPYFAEKLAAQGVPTQTGEFGAHMQVEIHNDGPVTIWMER